MIPSQTQEKILELFTKHPYLDTTRVEHALFAAGSRGYAHKLMKPLVEAKYLLVPAASFQAAKAGQAKALYTLGSKGRQLAKARGWEISNYFRPSETEVTDWHSRHTLAVSDVVILADRLVPRVSGLLLVEQKSERQLKAMQLTATIEQPAAGNGTPTPRTVAVIPDYFLHVQTVGPDPIQFPIFVELDRGTEHSRKIRHKILALTRFVQQSYPKRFGLSHLTIAYVCPTGSKRAMQLRAWAERVLTEHELTAYAPIFLFTGIDPFSADPLTFYTTPVFYQPFQREPVSLLELAAEDGQG